MKIEINDRELGTILAALRVWQGGGDRNWLHDIASSGGTFDPLNNDEIDVLCERLNFGEEG